MKIPLFNQGQPRKQLARPMQNGRVATGGLRPPQPSRPVKRPPPQHLQHIPVKKAVKKAPQRGVDFNDLPRTPVKKATQGAVKKAVKKAIKGVKKATKIANQLALIQERNSTTGRITLTDDNTLQGSVVGKNVDEIQKLLEEGNFETATNTVHKALLQMYTDILPFAEQAVRDTGGRHGVYQATSLGSMILETLNSARAQADRGQLGQHLIERVVQPAFKSLAEALVREFMVLDADLSTARPEQTQELARDARNRLAASAQEAYKTISSETIKFMSG